MSKITQAEADRVEDIARRLHDLAQMMRGSTTLTTFSILQLMDVRRSISQAVQDLNRAHREQEAASAKRNSKERCKAGIDNMGGCSNPEHLQAGLHLEPCEGMQYDYDRCRRYDDGHTKHILDCGGMVDTSTGVWDFTSEWVRYFEEVEKAGGIWRK